MPSFDTFKICALKMSVERELSSELVLLPESNAEEEKESYKWTHKNTLLFLDFYKKYRKEVGSLKMKNFKRMFEEIAKEMQKVTMTRISAANCENRWKVLERSYKKFIDDSNKTGRGRKTFEYTDIMNEILGKKKNIRPVLLLSSGIVGSSIENKEHFLEEATQPSISTVHEELPESGAVDSVTNDKPTPKKAAPNKKLKFDIQKQMRRDRKEYYRKRLEIEEKLLAEKNTKNKLLEEQNKLMEKYLQKNADICK